MLVENSTRNDLLISEEVAAIAKLIDALAAQPGVTVFPSAANFVLGLKDGKKRFADTEIEALQALLDLVPAPLDALDTVSLDGFLCGVLLQPRPVPSKRSRMSWTSSWRALTMSP